MAYTTINKSSEYFNTHLYSGNDTTNNQQVGLTPDLVWVKCRNSAIPSHYIVDKVRGNEKYISSNASTAEQTDSNTFELVSGGFNLDGGNGWTNLTGRNYVAWNWLGGGTGVSNTDGSITSTVSANTTSGFSIVKYVGTGSNATVGHGLGVAPSIVLVKNLDDGTQQWSMYNKNLPLTDIIILDSTNAAFNPSDNDFQDTAPTANAFYVNGGATRTNVSSQNFIAYCFAEKKGYSKFGSYTGNGNANGTFVYTGFKPAFVILKRTSTSGNNWQMTDNKRDTYNPNQKLLAPSSPDDETALTYILLDNLSNGFKLRSTAAGHNTNGDTYIYMAFAENPLVGTNGIPATAR